MHKSGVLHNYDDYVRFMIATQLWTNVNYKPSGWNRPTEFPMICVADLFDDINRGRLTVFEEWVSLRDFADEINLEVFLKEEKWYSDKEDEV